MTTNRRTGRDRISTRRTRTSTTTPRPQYLRLVSYITMLILVFVLIGRVKQPGSMSWLTGETKAQPAPVEKQTRTATQEKAGTAGNPDPAPPGQVNPEGLVQIGECSELIPELLSDLVDKTGKRASDNPAIYHLLCVAATTPAERLRAKAATDVFYHQVVATPERYRGKPIWLRGIVRRCFPTELAADRNPHGIGKIYEAWFFSEDQQNNPARILFLRPPANFPIGFDLNQWVEMPAYFVRLYAFESTDQRVRAVPMYVGHEMFRYQQPEKPLAQGIDVVFASLLGTAILVGAFILTVARPKRASAVQPALSADPVVFDPNPPEPVVTEEAPVLDFLDRPADNTPEKPH